LEIYLPSEVPGKLVSPFSILSDGILGGSGLDGCCGCGVGVGGFVFLSSLIF
jgi:hypothetical protein